MFRRALSSVVAQVGAQTRSVSEKVTTGLVGLKVDPLAREKIVQRASLVLRSVGHLPEGAGFRTDTEETFSRIRDVCQNKKLNDRQVEQTLGRGNLEQVLAQCEDHLKLIPTMREEKPWEVPKDHLLEVRYWRADEPPAPPVPK
ncbi:unnamed protein product [Pedinophyceae sp. YPF-701]|nr:unnamed protein product [Pedinophyceae sp. YPF-701]